MRTTTLAIYRLPTPSSTQVGHVRVVIDRHQQVYLSGSKIVTATPSGDFLILTVANEDDRRYGLERYSTETRRLYAVMDRRLAAQEFFADEPSIADFAILGWAWRHPRHKVDLAEFPHVNRWYRTMMARPGVQRGFAVKLS